MALQIGYTTRSRPPGERLGIAIWLVQWVDIDTRLSIFSPSDIYRIFPLQFLDRPNLYFLTPSEEKNLRHQSPVNMRAEMDVDLKKKPHMMLQSRRNCAHDGDPRSI